MTGNAKNLRAMIIVAAELAEPTGTAPQDGRHNRNRFNIVDGGRTTIKTYKSWKRRFESGLTFFSF